MRKTILTALAITAAVPAAAQSQTAPPTMTLYEFPGYIGRSVTVTAEAPDLATQGFAKRAQSARVSGSWQVCPAVKYGGSCTTLANNAPFLMKAQIVSVRPTPTATSAAATTAATPTTTGQTATSASATAAIDLDALDAGGGTEGQDVAFYARPSLSGSEISAGTNDITSATAFCKLAGATSASYAGRTRVQASGLIDLSAKAKVRGYALRDVVCRR
ncbi:MAG: beta/gamma crystallin-related protein [Sphingobium sp.]